MKKILVTQRFDYLKDRDEPRDAVDSRWAKLLWDLNFFPVMASNKITQHNRYFDEINPQGILITGGNDIGEAAERDALETAALEYAQQKNIPVFGVCRGLQIINHYQKGKLIEIKNHVAQKHIIRGSLFPGEVEVNSYHGYGITPEILGKDLIVEAQTDDGVIEAVRHEKLPWLAVMWHPERETPFKEFDLDLIKQHFT